MKIYLLICVLCCSFCQKISAISTFFDGSNDSLTLTNYLSTKNIKAEKTVEGLFYTVHTEGLGTQPQQGDYVKIKYVGSLLSGKIFDKSPENEPYMFKIGSKEVIAGWDIAVQKLSVGSKATLYIPSDLAYGSMGIEPVIAPNTPLIFEIEVIDILTKNDYKAQLNRLEDSDKHAFNDQITQQFDIDKHLINDYALLHRLKVKRTETGLSYIITKEGKGDSLKIGMAVSLHYDGKLLSDSLFDTTKDREIYHFTLGQGKTMLGWEEGLLHFRKGSEGYLLIPSKLGYGSTLVEDGKINIPPHSVLIFKIYVLDK